MLRGKAETNYQQAKESSSTHQQNGHRGVNKRLLLLRELSVSLKSGIGSIGASRTSVQEPNAHNVQSDRTAAKHRAPKQASPLVSDPRFQQLHLARYKAMTGCLQRYGASKLVVMEISFALVSHEENIVALLNPSRLSIGCLRFPTLNPWSRFWSRCTRSFTMSCVTLFLNSPTAMSAPACSQSLSKLIRPYSNCACHPRWQI